MRTTWPQPDFLADPRTRRPAIAWLWSAVALVIVAFSLGDWHAAQHDLDAQRRRLARAAAREPVAAPAARPASASASDLQARRAAREVVDRITHPWDQLLNHVEVESPDGLQWLALDHEADNAGVRLEGAATDVESVLHFVDNLSDHAGWSDVVLERLQMAEGREAASASATPWRFALHAVIDARRLALARPAEDR